MNDGYNLGKCWLQVTSNEGSSLNVKTESLLLSIKQEVIDYRYSRGGVRNKGAQGPKKFTVTFETYADLMVTHNGQDVNTETSFTIGSTSLNDWSVLQLLEEVKRKQKLAAVEAAQK